MKLKALRGIYSLPKTIYYNDMKNDDFTSMAINLDVKVKEIKGDYCYIRKGVWRKFTHFFWYRIVVTPILNIFMKIKFRHKIVGSEKLKAVDKDGYFIYGNHTQTLADAFIPTVLSGTKDMYVIVNPSVVSLPIIGHLLPSMGAIPLPNDFAATKNFTAAIKERVSNKNAVCIYPEAHIWPYYTDIRPFGDGSFAYPIKNKKPIFCFTNTYQKRKGGKVQIVTYIDGPFYPNAELSQKEQKRELRDQVFNAMKLRTKNNSVQVVEYIPAVFNDSLSFAEAEQ